MKKTSQNYDVLPSYNDSSSPSSSCDVSSNSQPKIQTTPFIIIIAAITASLLGSLQYGWALGIVNNTEKRITNDFDSFSVDSNRWNTYTSMVAIGGMFGGSFGGPLVTHFGRKYVLLALAVFCIVGNLLQGFGNGFAMLVVGRILVGFGSGLATCAVPVFVAEISPSHVRGALGTLNQLCIIGGMLLAQLSTMFTDSWEWGFYIPALVCFISALLFLYFPETPSYLISRGKVQAATKSFYKYRNITKSSNGIARRSADREFEVMCNQQKNEHEREEEHHHHYQEAHGSPQTNNESLKGEWKDLITFYPFRKALFVGVMLQFCQQFSGINAIFQYSTQIFVDAGLSGKVGNVPFEYISSAIVAAVNVVVTMATIPLMDRLGRRLLMMIGFAGMSVSWLILAFSFVFDFSGSKIITVIATILICVFFACGPGSVPWFIIAEFFPTSVRSKATAICTFANWFFAFIIIFGFPPLNKALGDYTFFPFAVLNFLFFVFVWTFCPETKGTAIEDAVKLFEKKTSNNTTTNSNEETPLLK